MKKAISYVRFSSLKQRNSKSQQRQREQIQEWLAKNPDYYLDESLSMNDLGKSAFKGHHITQGAFGGFMDACRKGLIPDGTVLLVESLDRISREDVIKAQGQLIEIIQSGVIVHTLIDDQTYSKENYDFGRMIMSLAYMERSHNESKTKRDRGLLDWSKRNKLARLDNEDRKILGANIPAWLTIENNAFTVTEWKADIVRLIFKLRAEGMPTFTIAKYLNENGYKPINDKARKNVKPGYGEGTIKAILINKAVIGTLPASQRNELFTEIAGYYPKIVEPEQFKIVQERLSLNTGKKAVDPYPNSVNIFKGILKCAHCSGRIAVSGSSPKQMGSYKCFHSQTSNGCNAKSLSRLKFEKAMTERLFSLLQTIDLNPAPKINSDIREVESRLADVTSRLNNIYELAEQGSERAKARVLVLEAEEIDVKRELSKLMSQQARKFTGLITDDLKSVEGRRNAQLSIREVVKEIRFNSEQMTCDVILQNGNIIQEFSLKSKTDHTKTLTQATDEFSGFSSLEDSIAVFGKVIPTNYSGTDTTVTTELNGYWEDEIEYPPLSGTITKLWPESEEPDYPNTDE